MRLPGMLAVGVLLAHTASLSAQAQCDTDFQLINGSAVGDLFAGDLDLAGNTLVIGAPDADAFGVDSGNAYVYELAPGGIWVETTQLTGSTVSFGDNFGAGVSIGTNRIAVGATGDGGPTPGFGTVYVFERQPDNSWLQIARLLASDRNTGDEFGKTVAMTADDNTIVVGAPSKSQPSVTLQSGAVYVFEFDSVSGSFQEAAKLLPSTPTTNEYFGDILAVDGDRLAVSGNRNWPASTAIYVFERVSGVWQPTVTFTPGSRFALSGDTLVAPGTNGITTYDYSATSGWTTTITQISTSLSFSDATLDGDDRLAVSSQRIPSASWPNALMILDRDALTGNWVSVTEFDWAVQPIPGLFSRPEVLVLDGDHLVAGADQDILGTPAYTGVALSYKVGDVIFDASDGCLSASTGGMITFDIDAGSANAGNGYWILGSASGTSPGFDYNGTNIPLNIDPYLNLTFDPVASPITNGVGALDANGQASATLSVNADPSLSGGTAYHLCVIYDIATLSVIEVSRVITLELTP